jgi:signal peptide peptidase SppA
MIFPTWFEAAQTMKLPLQAFADHCGETVLAIDPAAFAAGPRQRSDPPAAPQGVALIPIFGALMPRSSWYSAGMDAIRSAIDAAAASADVSAIALIIDSPGGTVAGTPETAARVRAAAAQKPVMALADTLAASAAYWIGSQATKFYVAPSADVGSIGVFSMHADYSRALSEAGVGVTIIKSGLSEYKAEGNPYQPLSAEGLAAIQDRVDAACADFIRAVSQGRGVSQAQVKDNFGKGRIVGAKDAVAAGMADGVMTLSDLIASLSPSPSGRKMSRRAALV